MNVSAPLSGNLGPPSPAGLEVARVARKAKLDARACPLCGERPEFRGIASTHRRSVLVIECRSCGPFRIEASAARLGPFSGPELDAIRAVLETRDAGAPPRCLMTGDLRHALAEERLVVLAGG
jgi:hypothetical protein